MFHHLAVSLIINLSSLVLLNQLLVEGGRLDYAMHNDMLAVGDQGCGAAGERIIHFISKVLPQEISTFHPRLFY